MIEKIAINHFRNFKTAQLLFHPNLNIFIGLNGQGKTNLLEAIQLSICGTSFKAQDRLNWLQLGFEHSSINSDFYFRDVSNSTRIIISKTDRKIVLNDKAIAPFKYRNLFSPVVFDPDSLDVIKQSAEGRRNFIDDISLNLFEGTSAVQNDFKKILKIRNKSLKEYSEGLKNLHEVKKYLDSIEELFLEKACLLVNQRIKTIQSLVPEVNKVLARLQNNADLKIEVQYLISNIDCKHKNTTELNDLLRKRLAELASSELSLGTSLIGPHKHEIKILFNGNDSRFFCSQGQQRSLILAFKMAQIVYHQQVKGYYPILILDDVLSELDDEKRDALIDFLGQLPTQIFISSTNYDLPSQFKSGVGKVFWVSEGKVNEY